MEVYERSKRHHALVAVRGARYKAFVGFAYVRSRRLSGGIPCSAYSIDIDRVSVHVFSNRAPAKYRTDQQLTAHTPPTNLPIGHDPPFPYLAFHLTLPTHLAHFPTSSLSNTNSTLYSSRANSSFVATRCK